MVYGEHKGISKSQIAQQIARGSDVGLRLDVQGAATVRKMLTNEASVFECPCARVGGASTKSARREGVYRPRIEVGSIL